MLVAMPDEVDYRSLVVSSGSSLGKSSGRQATQEIELNFWSFLACTIIR